MYGPIKKMLLLLLKHLENSYSLILSIHSFSIALNTNKSDDLHTQIADT